MTKIHYAWKFSKIKTFQYWPYNQKLKESEGALSFPVDIFANRKTLFMKANNQKLE